MLVQKQELFWTHQINLLNKKCFGHIAQRLNEKTIIILNKENLSEEVATKYKNIIYLSELNADSKLYVNIEALGSVISLVKEDFKVLFIFPNEWK